MRKFLYIVVLISASLACGVQTSLPTQIEAAASTDVNSTPVGVTQEAETVQIVGSWNFRESPGESSPLISTLSNQEVQLIHCKPFAGGQWCKVSSDGVIGWVNQRGLK